MKKQEYKEVLETQYNDVIASYSFRYNAMTLFKRKVFQGVVLLEDIIQENEIRGYNYD